MEVSQVSSRAVAKVVLVAAAVVAVLYFSYLIRTVIGLFLIAAFFAIAIAPAVNWLDRRKVPRWAAILLVYLSIAAGIFGIGLLIIPPLVTGVETLSSDLPGYVDDLRNNQTFRDYDNRYHITEKLKEQADQLPSKLGDAAGTLRDVTVGVFSRFVQLFSILVITFFLVKDGSRLLEFFYRQIPEERARRFRKIANDISDAISGYVFGNFVISILAGLVTYVTLRILGVPFALPLAILFGFFDLIPLVGAQRKGREARMEEQLDILIKSWSTESFAHQGRYYQFPEIRVMPKPVQKPHPPIWIGASTEGGFRRAAKWADALCSSPRHHLSDLKLHYATYRRYLEQFGRKEACTPVIREVYCAETMKRAEEEGGPGMIYIQAGMYGRWAQVRELKDDRGQAVAGAAEVNLETFRERFILGDPEHCIRQIEKYQRELGMDYLQCMMDFPNVDAELTKKSMRLFARKVMPHFTKS